MLTGNLQGQGMESSDMIPCSHAPGFQFRNLSRFLLIYVWRYAYIMPDTYV